MIPVWISFHLYPILPAINAATADDIIKTIWILPDKASLPKRYTLMDNKTIRNMIGKIDSRRDGVFL